MCNFNCKWCFANAGVSGHNMHIEDVKKLIRSFVKHNIRQVTFSGGEPLMYPHIREVIEYAKSQGLIVHMNTNGYLFTKEIAHTLKDAGLSQIETNIDSLYPEKHDYIRGREGSFQRAVQTLKNAKDAGLTCVMQTVLTRQNEDEILDIFKFARLLGVQRSRVWDITPSDGCAKKNMDELNLMPTNYLETIKKLTEYASMNGGQNIESSDPLFPLDECTNMSVTGGFCVFSAGLVINISPKGDVFFCCTDRTPMYNIFEVIDSVDLREYHKAQLKNSLKGTEVPQTCNACNFNSKCRGGCLTRRKYSDDKTDYWCKYLKKPEVLSGEQSSEIMA